MAEEPRDQWGAPLYNALQGRLIANPQPRSTTGGPFMMGGKWYRQIDNGRQDVLVPIDDPTVSPVELAQRRAALERVSLMANSPLAGGAYGIAALAGGSAAARDRAMMAGNAVDGLMQGVAPLGARYKSTIRRPPTQPPLSTLPQEPIRYGRETETGQATAGDARITKSMLNTGEDVNRALKPPAWPVGKGNDNNVGRGHVIAKQFGGTARTLAQMFTITQNPTNRTDMGGYEADVARRVRNGEVVDYFVRPLYDAPGAAPSMILMSAQGSRGNFTPALIPNPIGGRR